MKKLVVYDSLYGNTEKIALNIAKLLKCKAIKVSELNNFDIKQIDLLIIGSPTHAGSSTQNIKNFMNRYDDLSHLKFGCFSTGVIKEDKNVFFKTLISILGYASKKMSKTMKNKGAKEILKPIDFFVRDKEGPLIKESINSSEKWIQNIIK